MTHSHDADWLNAVLFDDAGLVPAIAQDYATGRVLMVAWMNRESLHLTATTQQATYWSRSRQQLWRKGESSGHTQSVHHIDLDCDGDVVVLQVTQQGGIACHTGRQSCFYRRLIAGEWQIQDPVLKDPKVIYQNKDSINNPAVADNKVTSNDDHSILLRLQKVLYQRKHANAEDSYVASLYNKGLNKILEKIGEESTEVILAAKDYHKDFADNTQQQRAQADLIGEVADLWFHVMVMMAWHNLDFTQVEAELAQRFGLSGIVEKAQRSS